MGGNGGRGQDGANGTQSNSFGLSVSSVNFPLGSISATHYGCTNSEIILNQTFSQIWSFPNSSPIFLEGSNSSNSITIAYPSIGDYDVVVGSATYSLFLTIFSNRVLPTISLQPSLFCLGNNTNVQISVSNSYFEFDWKILDSSMNVLATSTSSSFTWVPTEIGIYTTQLRVKDCCGWSIPIISTVIF